MSRPLILATRKSPLAIAQSEMVAAHLRNTLGVEVELLKMVTTGDRQAEWSLEQKGGKGLFTSELEQALMKGEADLAVHSTKDLPGDLPAELCIAGYLPRADPRDVLVLRAGMAQPTTIATGSPRRRGQLMMMFPDAAFTEIRGNVDTRLRKIVEQGVADGTVLAAAGVARLGIGAWPGLEFHVLDYGQMVPAVGQGAIAVQTRIADAARFAAVLDATTARGVRIERAFQAALGGGCHTAFAAHAAQDTLYLFHEDVGLRSLPLDETDYNAPGDTARRVLKNLGLL
ncbi:MAG: hydroxymethylbilane synthase [Opitutaceae bacterium]|nr:hydroxymethylbilane synthase [Opitutaceae bacterium]